VYYNNFVNRISLAVIPLPANNANKTEKRNVDWIKKERLGI
jgi:hypothetical protein